MSTSSAAPLEPRIEQLQNPLQRYLLATRPAFLSVTLIGCLIGIASAWFDHVPLAAGPLLLGLLLALLAHAGVNVFNDYYDALNGTDAANTERLFPFTGGSRFIQNGVLSLRQTLLWGLALFALVIGGGLWLIAQSGNGLFWIGLAGLLIGWAYSAPPLKLNSRGLGEVCVTAGFVLLPIGMDYLARHAISLTPAAAGLSFGLLVTNLLYINQFPDRSADLQACKHHWVARLPVQQARWGYLLIVALAYTSLPLLVVAGVLPWPVLLGWLSLPLSLKATQGLLQHAGQPAQLAPAIQQTIGAASLHGLTVASGLLAARWLL